MRIQLDTLKLPGITLVGVCQGGIETCIMVPEVNVMFDVGLCPPGCLKFNTVLASHGHADHLGGLHYLVSQRQMHKLKPMTVHVPEEIVPPLTKIFELWSEIEGIKLKVALEGHAPGAVVTLSSRYRALAIRTIHRVPSLAWLIERRDGKLKPEYQHLSGLELRELRMKGATLTDEQITPLLCVTGDTTIETFDREPALRTCRILVHEVTGWDERRDPQTTRAWGHTHVRELIERAEQFEGEALVLVHRSARHSRQQSLAIVKNDFPASVRDKVFVLGA